MIPPMDIKYFMLTCSVLTDMVSAYRILHASHRLVISFHRGLDLLVIRIITPAKREGVTNL